MARYIILLEIEDAFYRESHEQGAARDMLLEELQQINIGKVNNQKFVSIPHNRLIQQLQYKLGDIGIHVTLQEESYTSKVDHLAFESMEHHEKYMGKRVHRGLFQSSTGRQLSADVNGAIGILRKVIGDVSLQELFDRGVVLTPIKMNIF